MAVRLRCLRGDSHHTCATSYGRTYPWWRLLLPLENHICCDRPAPVAAAFSQTKKSLQNSLKSSLKLYHTLTTQIRCPATSTSASLLHRSMTSSFATFRRKSSQSWPSPSIQFTNFWTSFGPKHWLLMSLCWHRKGARISVPWKWRSERRQPWKLAVVGDVLKPTFD